MGPEFNPACITHFMFWDFYFDFYFVTISKMTCENYI